MAFDDLDEAAGEQQESDGDETTEASTTETGTVNRDATDTTDTTPDRAQDAGQSDPREDPAFPFDQSSQQTNVYVREQSQEAWADAKDFEIKRTLRQDRDVRNVEGRELDDAMVRLAADHPDLVAAYVMDARGIDVPDSLADRLSDDLGE